MSAETKRRLIRAGFALLFLVFAACSAAIAAEGLAVFVSAVFMMTLSAFVMTAALWMILRSGAVDLAFWAYEASLPEDVRARRRAVKVMIGGKEKTLEEAMADEIEQFSGRAPHASWQSAVTRQ